MSDDQPQPSSQTRNQWVSLIICLLLVAAVWAVFGQTIRDQFVNFDDEDYFLGNPHVQTGLNRANMAWAFQVGYAANWHPLTWLSLMLDAQLFGPGPAGPHLTNVLLHAANAVLLFLLLRRLTDALWPAALVAALFAVHPLHVESVAWVSERKDVLCAFFFLLTLLTYASYAWCVAQSNFRMAAVYGLSLLFFALGLMSKPMVVTVPFVLMLLDYWPLQRLSVSTLPKLICEKIPFLALSVISSVLTLIAQKTALTLTLTLPFWIRLGNALISYVLYLGQMVKPTGLAVFYPYYQNRTFYLKVTLSVLFLLGISAAVWRWRKRSPYLLFGWLWYLGMLVPVIGLLQVGGQAHADRYTYLPLIGIFIMLVWAINDFVPTWRQRSVVFAVIAAGVTGALMISAFRQALYWHDSESLWKHTIACTAHNHVAHGDLGAVFFRQGRNTEAAEQFQEALAINPRYVEAHNNYGLVLVQQGHVDDAIAQYQAALKIKPKSAEAHVNLGNVLVTKGQAEAGIEQFKEALQCDPNMSEAHNDWGAVLLTHGHPAEAGSQFEQAVALNPYYAEAENNWGTALVEQGKVAEATAHYLKSVQLKPDYAKAQFNLANLLAAQGRTREAIAHFQSAVASAPDLIRARYQLGVLLQSVGQYAAAVEQYQKILQQDPRHVPTQNNLAWLMATCPDASLRNGRKAVETAEQAIQYSGGKHPELLDTLAAGFAEDGEFDVAVTTARSALELAGEQNNQALVNEIKARLALYASKKPFRDIASH